MGKANFENRTLFQGDNLPFLQGINSETVDLIATDPPFNKSKDFHATPDSLAAGASFSDRWKWDNDVQPEWMDAIKDDWPKAEAVIQAAAITYGPDMAAFLCWLGVRLMECHRILKPTGSLYLHIDHTAQAWAKCLLDGIFGRENFRNELVWQYDGPQRPSRVDFARKHETILRYSKTGDYYGNTRETYPVALEEARKKYKQHSDGRWFYDLPPGDYTPTSIARLEQEGRIRRTRNGKIRVMFFLQEINGLPLREKTVPSVWSDIPSLGLTASSKENTGYPTQKPLALYERIIKASSKPGDVVLDPHCGCATTPVAAERLGRQWIGMDLWTGTYQMVLDRLNAEKQIWRPEDVKLTTVPPERDDDADTAAPYLRQLQGRRAQRPRFSRDEMKAILIGQWGAVCWGCGFEPPHADDRFFDLDHIAPKSEGGSNELNNRAILCRPCNGRKGNRITLTALRRENKRDGYWYGSPPIDQRIPIRLAVAWAREYLERATA